LTPWITKPVPFNIGQGAAAAAATPETTWEQTSTSGTYTVRGNDGFCVMNSIETGNVLIGLSGDITVTYTVAKGGSSSSQNIIVGIWDTPDDSDGHNVSSNFQLIESKTQASMPASAEEVTWEGTISSAIAEGNAIGLMCSNTDVAGVDINIYNANATNSLWWKNTGTAEQDGTQSNQFTIVIQDD